MDTYGLWISYYTMLRKDIVRMFRIWVQTFLPSVITSLIPGLVMLAIVTNAYSNTSFTFFQSKFFFRGIDEILVSPTPPWLLIAGFISGGIVRGVLVGTIVLLISAFFTGLHLAIYNLLIIF